MTLVKARAALCLGWGRKSSGRECHSETCHPVCGGSPCLLELSRASTIFNGDQVWVSGLSELLLFAIHQGPGGSCWWLIALLWRDMPGVPCEYFPGRRRRGWPGFRENICRLVGRAWDFLAQPGSEVGPVTVFISLNARGEKEWPQDTEGQGCGEEAITASVSEGLCSWGRRKRGRSAECV